MATDELSLCDIRSFSGYWLHSPLPERHIRRSELFQLILLQHLYARPESSSLIFKRGTAIRWCHNSGRFSEDLDFVTHLERPALERLMKGVEGAVALDQG